MSDVSKELVSEPEALTFANFNPAEHSVYEIGGDVLPQMAEVFGHTLENDPDVDNLGQLIELIGPAKELQQNIQGVQQRIGANEDAVDLARSWVERSGLLTPVERSFLDPEDTSRRDDELVGIITGGVRNWMQRRADLALKLTEEGVIFKKIILAAGHREMAQGEGQDVAQRMTEIEYMNLVLANKLHGHASDVVQILAVDSGVGDDVGRRVASSVDESDDEPLVISNAGVWVQNAGQISRGFRDEYGAPVQKDVHVVSDQFPLGTGEEPTATHQNPFSALSLIIRNSQEFVRAQS